MSVINFPQKLNHEVEVITFYDLISSGSRFDIFKLVDNDEFVVVVDADDSEEPNELVYLSSKDHKDKLFLEVVVGGKESTFYYEDRLEPLWEVCIRNTMHYKGEIEPIVLT